MSRSEARIPGVSRISCLYSRIILGAIMGILGLIFPRKGLLGPIIPRKGLETLKKTIISSSGDLILRPTNEKRLLKGLLKAF